MRHSYQNTSAHLRIRQLISEYVTHLRIRQPISGYVSISRNTSAQHKISQQSQNTSAHLRIHQHIPQYVSTAQNKSAISVYASSSHVFLSVSLSVCVSETRSEAEHTKSQSQRLPYVDELAGTIYLVYLTLANHEKSGKRAHICGMTAVSVTTASHPDR